MVRTRNPGELVRMKPPDRTLFIAVKRYEPADATELEEAAAAGDFTPVLAESTGVSGHAVTVEDGVATTATLYESRATAEASGRVPPARLKRAEFAISEVKVKDKKSEEEKVEVDRA
jgi:hypothetical protein